MVWICSYLVSVHYPKIRCGLNFHSNFAFHLNLRTRRVYRSRMAWTSWISELRLCAPRWLTLRASTAPCTRARRGSCFWTLSRGSRTRDSANSKGEASKAIHLDDTNCFNLRFLYNFMPLEGTLTLCKKFKNVCVHMSERTNQWFASEDARTIENTQRNSDIQKVLFDVTYTSWLILCLTW